jgi:hypothetical protein
MQDQDAPPDYRLWAAVQFHTLASGHPSEGYGRRSPWAVDEHGSALKVGDFAKLLGWSEQFTRRMTEDVERSGRIRLDDTGRFLLRAKVNPPATKKKGKNQRAFKMAKTVSLSPEIRKQIGFVPEGRRAAVERLCILAEIHFEHQAVADAMADAREKKRLTCRNILAHEGVDWEIPKRKNGHLPAVHVEIDLDAVPDELKDFIPVYLKENSPVENTSVHGRSGALYEPPQKQDLALSAVASVGSRNGKRRAPLEIETDIQEKSLFVCNERTLRDGDKQTNSSSKTKAEAKQAEIEAYLREFIRAIGRGPTTEEIQNVWLALGDASVAQLRTRVDARRGTGYPVKGYKFFEKIAEDCAAAAGDWESSPVPKPPQSGNLGAMFDEIRAKDGKK